MEPARLRIDEVRKLARGRDGNPVEILKGVSCEVFAGEILALVGPSGGGKSTLVRLLNRLEEPSAGSILLDGEDLRQMDPLQVRRRIGMVLQKPYMFPGSAGENLLKAFSLRHEPVPPLDSPLVAETLELCRFPADLLEQEARSLSLGQQQRLNLARCLVTAPEIVLLDEPTSALDRPTADRLGAGLAEFARRRRGAVLMVTHDLRLAERIADRLVYLEAGEILEQGACRELLAAPRTGALRRFLSAPEELEEACP
ncbi:phosphate ABC transporter ATP-binding protein [Desulfuromonas versatilis]|uniref:Phosphate ABC transporter ATP-binding protein n=1 Tax=Desulfuromonas versatilis TaxID=2802975 RepID=A0ABM8HY77_9BACT|nr:ATP-binding cassette domain-containing protein [Desulfuromonas versatilis]BCR05542.1 phosphate ABC transporter ATP-binding protein [Desulfuromonas versatilis]